MNVPTQGQTAQGQALSTFERQLSGQLGGAQRRQVRAAASRLRGQQVDTLPGSLERLGTRFPKIGARLLHRLSERGDPERTEMNAAFLLSATPRPWDRVIEDAPWTLTDPYAQLGTGPQATLDAALAVWAGQDGPDALDWRLSRHGVYLCRTLADELIAGLIAHNCLRLAHRQRLQGEVIVLIGDPDELRDCDSADEAACRLIPLVASVQVQDGQARLSFTEGHSNFEAEPEADQDARDRLTAAGVLPALPEWEE